MLRHFLLGTAGHVDHGKTSLIQALTGVDTDRLPEEKQRGLTIDLGFAALNWDDLQLGIVDVPGHERFVKNMLAGATGIDIALLVVAADEGVMPQTVEHFEALCHLQIEAGVVAITKSDLVDEEMLALVQEDIAELVAGSFLQEAEVVPVSSKTESGLKSLRTTLAEVARHLPQPDLDGPFRLPVDRCFSLPGKGTIVTGSVASGQVSCGDKLQLLPSGGTVTVRSIESHGCSLPSVGRGQRAALNLTGVHYSEITRGDILATPESLAASHLLSVQFAESRFRNKPLKPRHKVRFYSGTTEASGLLRILGDERGSQGQPLICQIELQQPVCATWGEPFVVRGLADNVVLGGGRVIDPLPQRIAASDTAKLVRVAEMLADDDLQRVAAVAALAGARNWLVASLSQRSGVAAGEMIVHALEEQGILCGFDLKGGRRWLHRDVVEKLEKRLLAALETEHQKASVLPSIPLARLQPYFSTLEPELLRELAVRLCDDRLRLDGTQVALCDWQPLLSSHQTALLAEMEEIYRQVGTAPPSVAELASQLELTLGEVEQLIDVAVSRKELVRLPDKDTRDAGAARRARLYLHPSCEQRFIDGLNTQLEAYPEWTVSQFCEALGLSRKYAIPLCNHLDNNGVTVRKGDLRSLVRPISTAQ